LPQCLTLQMLTVTQHASTPCSPGARRYWRRSGFCSGLIKAGYWMLPEAWGLQVHPDGKQAEGSALGPQSRGGRFVPLGAAAWGTGLCWACWQEDGFPQNELLQRTRGNKAFLGSGSMRRSPLPAQCCGLKVRTRCAAVTSAQSMQVQSKPASNTDQHVLNTGAVILTWQLWFERKGWCWCRCAWGEVSAPGRCVVPVAASQAVSRQEQQEWLVSWCRIPLVSVPFVCHRCLTSLTDFSVFLLSGLWLAGFRGSAWERSPLLWACALRCC